MVTGRSKRANLLAGACAAAACLPCAPALAQEASPFRSERFDEDWSSAHSGEAPFGAQFKNIEITDDVTVSFGGDARWRFIMLDAPRLGLEGAEADSWLLQRLLLHADLRFADNARAFVQLGAHDGIDHEIPSAADDNRFDIQQAFFDVSTNFFGGRLTVRTGRQELALGPRFATTRDGGNVHQRHDLVRAIYAAGPWRADLFGGNPVADHRGALDDETDDAQRFYGLKVQHKSAARTLDLYAYELAREAATLTSVTADDDRLSVGARYYGRAGPAEFDAEIMVQRGNFGAQDIRAAGALLDLGWRFPDLPLSPRVGGRFTYGSGDAEPADATQGTFTPPFPNGQWFGQNGLASFANTMEVAALTSIAPREDVSVNLKLSSVWRAETADFVYAGGGALANTSGGDDDFVGASAALSLLWRPNDNIAINPYVSYVSVGDHLLARGADDVVYAHMTVTLRF